jgi:hypothetical protein
MSSDLRHGLIAHQRPSDGRDCLYWAVPYKSERDPLHFCAACGWTGTVQP